MIHSQDSTKNTSYREGPYAGSISKDQALWTLGISQRSITLGMAPWLFYLLDCPGHAIDHLCSLIRITKSPDTFILLSGDVSHYAGIFRPSKFLPVPSSIQPHPFSPQDESHILPGHMFDELQKSRDREPTDPLYNMMFGHDTSLAEHTVESCKKPIPRRMSLSSSHMILQSGMEWIISPSV